ncbi:MAG: nucleotidyltransferase domain-containing protein [Candidatus Woesearchaeota archaeon]
MAEKEEKKSREYKSKENNRLEIDNPDDFSSKKEDFQKSIVQNTNIPREVQEKLRELKDKLNKFQNEVVKKFDKYIMGISLLPPISQQEIEEITKREGAETARKQKEKVNVLVLIDDTSSQKLTKEELKEKISSIIENSAKEIDPKLAPQTLLLSEVWQSCFDGKYEILKTIAMSAPIYDTGMLSAIRIAEVHKTMVLEKFEKYIVAYVLAGSLVQGKATPQSDIDVFIVIDDTDVKRMTRAELKDKLRAIIIGMGIQAGEITGIRNKINIQVYILTDFWESVKEAHPVIFTFLRDGIPFFDRGIFMPWKQLLKMGRIKPSAEAIEMYLSSGEQLIKRIEFKLNDIGIEDLFYALLTPSQAALMMYGIPPPTPKETPELLREIFVKKEKLFEESYVKILEKVIQIRKEVEHGTKKRVTGKEIDELLENAGKYLDRLKKLFTQIEKRKEEEAILQIYDSVISLVRDILILEGIERVPEDELLKMFDYAIIETGKLPEKFLRIISRIIKAKKEYTQHKLSKIDIQKITKEAGPLIRELIEYIQRKRGRELDRARIRVKYGNKYGEVIILDKDIYIIEDTDAKDKSVQKATLTPEGGIVNIIDSSPEEMEKAMSKIQIPPKVFIKEKLIEDLKKIFGSDLEILLNY